MKAFFTFLFFCIAALQLHATDASALVRKSNTVLTIKSVDRAEIETQKTISVFSEMGRSHAQLEFYEDNFQTTVFYKVVVKDREGKVLAKYDKNDFKRHAVIEAVSSYGAVNRYHMDCGPKRYPYILEIHSKMRRKSFFHFTYGFAEVLGTEYRNSGLEVVYPSDYRLSYDLNRPESIAVSEIAGKRHHTLKFELAAFSTNPREPYAPEFDYPRVFIVPNVFKYGGVTGSFDSWQEYGLWINELWEGRD